jgi:hypothetical protein
MRSKTILRCPQAAALKRIITGIDELWCFFFCFEKKREMKR